MLYSATSANALLAMVPSLNQINARYSGALAESYDADRCHSLRWAREQLAVNDFVTDGPVLDCPVGTGRYVGIYRDKGLDVIGIDVSEDMLDVARRNYPGINARQGNVLGLPFGTGMFGTAMCTRLLDWLPPADMARAVAELRRVARTLVLTIRHGTQECRVNYTHDLSAFYAAIDGLYIDQRRVTEITRDGTEEIFLLRPPKWADVLEQFRYDPEFIDPEDDINRIANEWTGRLWPFAIRLTSAVKVEARYLPADELTAIVDRMAAFDPLYRTAEPPRFTGGPITVLRVGEKLTVLDGRRRVNSSRGRTGLFPVLMVTVAEPSRS